VLHSRSQPTGAPPLRPGRRHRDCHLFMLREPYCQTPIARSDRTQGERIAPAVSGKDGAVLVRTVRGRQRLDGEDYVTLHLLTCSRRRPRNRITANIGTIVRAPAVRTFDRCCVTDLSRFRFGLPDQQSKRHADRSRHCIGINDPAYDCVYGIDPGQAVVAVAERYMDRRCESTSLRSHTHARLRQRPLGSN